MKTEVQNIFKNCSARELDELVIVLQSMIRDVKDERIDLAKVRAFFDKNRDALEALLELCSIDADEADEIIRKLVNLVARLAVFSAGGLLRKYSFFSTKSYMTGFLEREEEGSRG